MFKQLDNIRISSITCGCISTKDKMARLRFTLAWVTLLLQILPTQGCDSFFGNGFDLSHQKIQSRIFTGKRLSVDETNPTFLTRAVVTSLECLDFCLRFDHCVSFDFLPHENICRINRVTQRTMPLVEERNWTHFNLSSVYLRKVG